MLFSVAKQSRTRLFSLRSLLLCFLFVPQVWAQPELIITRGNGNWPPYEMVENGELTGFHIDLVRAVAKTIDVKVTFQTYPWQRAVQMAKTGRADAITYMAKNADREAFFHFSENNILSGTDHYLIKNRKRHDINFDGEIAKLTPFTLVHIDGYTFGNAFDNAEDINRTGVKSADYVVKLVAKDRYDLGIISPVDLRGAGNSDLLSSIEFLHPPLYSTTVYLCFSKQSNNTHMIERFTQAMAKFKQTIDYQTLLIKYGIH